MNKKQFIALADAIREHNSKPFELLPFGSDELNTLADFCQKQNPAFDRKLWLAYTKGEVGPHGGNRAASKQ